jgi:mRNA interferase RelE/StbE
MQRRLRAGIAALAADPRGKGVVKLQGREGYRLRVGSWRVLFVIDDAGRTVTISALGPRRDVYRF